MSGPEPAVIQTDGIPKPGTYKVQSITSFRLSDVGAKENKDVADELKSPAYNKRALTKTATTYKLELFDKNLLIIFNQMNIIGLEPRTGALEDVKELSNVFLDYGFNVNLYDDMTKDEIFKILDDHDKTDFTDYGAIAIVILTHGTSDGALFAHHIREVFGELDILERLSVTRKPTLVTKPKLLFIQALRGYECTKGPIDVASDGYRLVKDYEVNRLPIPTEVDTLVFHSSYLGKPSYRPSEGSWFIKLLCQKIREYAHTDDLLTICTEVQREIACSKYYDYERRVEKKMKYSYNQMPTITSNLIRKLYFNTRNSLDLDDTPNVCISIEQRKKREEGENTAILDHLHYMTNCLRHYTKEHPYDATSRYLLEAAAAVETKNAPAKITLIAISNYLENKLQNKEYAKYIYFYGIDRDDK